MKATAHAWFRAHRETLDASPEALELDALNIAFTSLLEFADLDTSRSRYVAELKILKTGLIALRSQTLRQKASTAGRGITAPPSFAPLVQDARMQAILERRWRETQFCLQAGAHLAATVMMGGLLEGLLLARANRVQPAAPLFTSPRTPKDRHSGKPLALKEWMLKDFIDVAHDLKWISKSAMAVGGVVREYRNYIHPQKELAHGITLDEAETVILWSVFESISRQVIASVDRKP